MPMMSTIWIAIADNYSFCTDKIPDRFIILNLIELNSSTERQTHFDRQKEIFHRLVTTQNSTENSCKH